MKILKNTTILPIRDVDLNAQKSLIVDIINDLSVVIIINGSDNLKIVEIYDYFAGKPYFGTKIDVIWISEFTPFEEFFEDLLDAEITEPNRLLALSLSPIQNNVADFISTDEIDEDNIDYIRLKQSINKAYASDN
mgnify:CR=1 FL=1